MSKGYGAEDIEVLEGLEPVRKRPGMFIAGTDTPDGLHQLVAEIVDNCVDEAMNGFADCIELTLHADASSVTVTDNGRGIPVERHPRYGKSTLELILTTLHAGGKFSDKNYKTSGGLHGVGSSVVNALSESLVALVRRDGKEYRQEYCRGQPKGAVKTVNKSVHGSGTSIFFRPDREIFRSIVFSRDTLREMLRTKAFLNPQLKVVFVDETSGSREEFAYSDGLRAYLQQILEEGGSRVVGEPLFIERENGLRVSMALAWTENTREDFFSYVNGIHTSDGGSHEQGAKSGIIRAVRNYISVHGIALKGLKLGAEDIREGLVGVLSVQMPGTEYQLQFQGQTKSRLNNPEVAPLVESAVRALEQQLNEKPTLAQAIVNRITLAAKARAASRAASQEVRRKVGISHRLTLPGKLADCSSTRPSECELFIVEGDSAGGSTKQGRNRQYQAVLPLRGKVLNTISSGGRKLADNKELSNIVAALGCGAGEECRVERLRYGKVIILTDADADGMHIATLLMAFFFTHLKAVIGNGSLYLGKPPLYGIFPKGMSANGRSPSRAGKKGKRARNPDSPVPFWAYSDEELSRILAEKKPAEPRIVRYKGLGEMNPETLWETTLDPDRRTLLRVTIDDESYVREALRDLMGSDPSKRHSMIQDSADRLELDI